MHPSPVSDTFLLPPGVPVTVSVALAGPSAWGVKLIAMAWLAPQVRFPLKPAYCNGDPGGDGATLKEIGTPPELVMVMLPELVVPTRI